MAGITAIQGVDETLRQLSVSALEALAPTPPVAVTVGPLDRDDDQPRLNWFLYRIAPNATLANMEPPGNGWRSARGRPPLALQLSYLLSAHPGRLTANGEEDQFAHRALTVVMQRLHDNAVVGEGDADLSSLARPLTEPLRITMESLDLEALSKLWSAAAQPLRLGVGYVVRLVVIDSTATHTAGPPVRERRVGVLPAMGPRLVAWPATASAGVDLVVDVENLSRESTFSLATRPGDPALPPGGWPLEVLSSSAGRVTLRVAPPGLVPGRRRLWVSAGAAANGVAGDGVDLTLVPLVTGPAATVAAGATVVLAVAHGTADTEVFLDGRPVPASSVGYDAARSEVTFTVPPATSAGPVTLGLRASKVAGPSYRGVTVKP